MSDGNPGVLYFGDVGWAHKEELNVVTGPGQNFGWPAFEGMLIKNLYVNACPENPDAPNALYNGTTCTQEFYKFTDLIKQYDGTPPTFPEPCNPLAEISPVNYDLFAHKKPAADWRNTVPRASIDGVVYDIGSPEVPGTSLVGKA